MTMQSRSDDQNRALLARLKPEHENLRRGHIRAEGDAERAATDLARIEQEILQKYGTTDVEQLQAQIEAGWERNTAAVDSFQGDLGRVRDAAQRLDAEDRAIDEILRQPNTRIADLGRLLDDRLGRISSIVDEMSGAA